MAAFVLFDSEILLGDTRLGAVSNSVSLDVELSTEEVTTLTSGGWRSHVPGLREGSFTAEGFVDASALEVGGRSPDLATFDRLALNDPLTVSPGTAALTPCYTAEALRSQLDTFGDIGGVHPFTLGATLVGKVGRGVILKDATTTHTSAGNGPTWVSGVVPALVEIVATLHVLSISGTAPVLTVTIQRDDNAGFASPVAAWGFAPQSAPGGQVARILGTGAPDDRWRVVWTLTGTTPLARFAVGIGITIV